jgi:hypothetical protein
LTYCCDVRPRIPDGPASPAPELPPPELDELEPPDEPPLDEPKPPDEPPPELKELLEPSLASGCPGPLSPEGEPHAMAAMDIHTTTA